MLCYMSNPCVLLTSDEDYRSRVCHFHHDVIRPQVGEKHPTPSGKIFFSESIPWNSIICRKIRREGEEDIFCVSVARSLVGKERTKRRRRGSRIYYTVGYYPPTHTHTRLRLCGRPSGQLAVKFRYFLSCFLFPSVERSFNQAATMTVRMEGRRKK